MTCPACGHHRTKVVDSRSPDAGNGSRAVRLACEVLQDRVGETVVRRRRCFRCAASHPTVELWLEDVQSMITEAAHVG